MKVRPAQESDLEQMQLLLAQLGYEVASHDLHEQFNIYHRSYSSEILVAESSSTHLSGLISGHAIPLLHQNGNVGRITALVVSDAFRGQGVGSKLVKSLEDWFHRQGCLRLEVTSGDHRADAHRFYEAQGYQLDERRYIKRAET